MLHLSPPQNKSSYSQKSFQDLSPSERESWKQSKNVIFETLKLYSLFLRLQSDVNIISSVYKSGKVDFERQNLFLNFLNETN